MKTLVLAVLAVAAPLAAATQEHSFEVAPDGNLHIQTDRGHIEIRTADIDIVTVRAQNADKLELEFDHDGDTVRIEGKQPESALGWLNLFNWSDRKQPRFIVTVPRRFNLDLRTGGGPIEVDDLEGTVKARTSGGHMRFGRIDGPVEARTSGGSIDLVSCVGRADVRTSGGHITIDRVDGDVIAKTSGGHIKVNEVRGAIEAKTSGGMVSATITRQPAADCHLQTSGGHVTVRLAADIAADVDAHTSGGRIHSDFPVSGELGRHLRSPINGGGPQLNLRTSGGHIHLKKL